MVLSNFLPSLSLSNIKLIFHSFQLHVTHVWSPSTADPNLYNYFALAVLAGSQKCFQSKWKQHSLPPFSLPIFPKSLVLCCWLSSVCSFPSPLHTFLPLVSHSLALCFIWTCSQYSFNCSLCDSPKEKSTPLQLYHNSLAQDLAFL